MFGYSNSDELPELPKYKMDENQQIVIDDIIEENKKEEEIEEASEELLQEDTKVEQEAPMPEREEGESASQE